MASLAVAREFLGRFSKLDHALQKRVTDLAEKCRQLSLAELSQLKGIQLEKYQSQKDSRARTIRLGDKARGIVLVSEGTEQIVLVDVLPHQQAERWMANNEFQVNASTGALEVVSAGAVAETAQEIEASAPAARGASRLFEHRKDKDFLQLGIGQDLLPVLRVLEDERQLEGLLTVLPDGQAEALILLTGDDTVETAYRKVAGAVTPADIDVDDVVAALRAPASRSTFFVVNSEDDLSQMLAFGQAQKSRRSSRYDPLRVYLAGRPERVIRMSFAEIDEILGSPLPNAARKYRPWWANERSGTHVQARSWLYAGRRTTRVDMNAATVDFVI